MDHPPAYVYILSRPGRCKIGRSISAVRRGMQIASGAGLNDVRLHIAFPVLADLAPEIEACAHEIHQHVRSRGEWFELDPDVAAKSVIEAIGIVARRHAVEGQNLVPENPNLPKIATSELIRDRLEKLFPGQ